MAEWQAVMTPREFAMWGEVYRQQPFDDYNRIHRPAALIASSFGGDLREMLQWLAPDLCEAASDAEKSWARALGISAG